MTGNMVMCEMEEATDLALHHVETVAAMGDVSISMMGQRVESG